MGDEGSVRRAGDGAGFRKGPALPLRREPRRNLEERIEEHLQFERLLADGYKATSYPIHEYWQDVGRLDDFERAKREFMGVFQAK